MPTVTANNCEMFYQIDDFTDPWRTDTETVWLQTRRRSQHQILVSLGTRPGRSVSGHSTRYARPRPVGGPRTGPQLVARRAGDRYARLHGRPRPRPGPLHRRINRWHPGRAVATRWPERFKSLTICNSPTTIRPSGTQALSSQDGNVTGPWPAMAQRAGGAC